jgi:hypothetical protein
MSAQAIDFGLAVSSASVEVDHGDAEVAEDNHNIINRIRFETLYQLYFAPEPTPGQIAMEKFLLECD